MIRIQVKLCTNPLLDEYSSLSLLQTAEGALFQIWWSYATAKDDYRRQFAD